MGGLGDMASESVSRLLLHLSLSLFFLAISLSKELGYLSCRVFSDLFFFLFSFFFKKIGTVAVW